MPAIDRTTLNGKFDSDGTPGSGSGIDKQFIEDVIYVPVDAAISAGGTLLAGSNYINDTANAKMTIGLTINQGANDDEILSLKSSDVAHDMTDDAETDTFAMFKKASPTEGGLQIRAFSEGTSSFIFDASVTTDNAVRSTSAVAPFMVRAWGKSGSGATSLNVDKNLATIGNATATKFIFDSDGDSHQDVGTAWTNFDTHDDVSVLNLLAAYVTRPDDPLRAAFGDWLLQSRDTLERLRLVTFNDDGHHFVNMSRLTMLLVGAMRQMGARVDRLEQRLLALEA